MSDGEREKDGRLGGNRWCLCDGDGAVSSAELIMTNGSNSIHPSTL